MSQEQRRFSQPGDVAVAQDGTIYVADAGHGRIVKLDADCRYISEWGTVGSRNGEFKDPRSIAIDETGTVYVVDGTNNRIQRFDSNGRYLGKWGQEGKSQRDFQYPVGIGVGRGRGTGLPLWVYVSDWDFYSTSVGDKDRISVFSSSGQYDYSWGVAGKASKEFSNPSGITVTDRHVLVADNGNDRIQRFDLGGAFVDMWGATGTSLGQLNNPSDVAQAASGSIFVTDTGNDRIQRFDNSGRPVTAWGTTGNGAGQFNWPTGLAIAANDTLLVADTRNDRIVRYALDGTFRGVCDGSGVPSTIVPSPTPTSALTATSTPPMQATLLPTRTSTPSARRQWTFMLYFDGDNNLNPWMESTKTRIEANPDNPAISYALLADGPADGDSTRFIVQPGGQYTDEVNQWSLGELNMGDGDTLASFVTWARTALPADHYFLAVVDHGRGTSGISWDDTDGDYIDVSELGGALQRATLNGTTPLDVVLYDACLMAMIENAYEIRNYVHYLAGYENLGWSVFAEDQYGLAAISASDPEQLSRAIVLIYDAAIPGLPRTSSALRLADATMVQMATSQLAVALTAAIGSQGPQIAEARRLTQKFDSQGYGYIDDDDEYIDLRDFAEQLQERVTDVQVIRAAAVVQMAVDRLVIIERHGSSEHNLLENAHGVSIYFPPGPGGWGYDDYMADSYRFASDGQWDEFLEAYFQALNVPSQNSVDPGLPPFPCPRQMVFLPLGYQER